MLIIVIEIDYVKHVNIGILDIGNDNNSSLESAKHRINMERV